MRVGILLFILAMGWSAQAREPQLEMSVPEKFAQEVQEAGLFRLGDIISFTAKLETLNDNILHGLAMAADLTHYPNEVDRDTAEGDDRGLTFKAKLVAEWGFEEGSLALEMFTANYSRLAYQRDEWGIPRYRNHATNKVYAEHLIHNEAKVNFVKNLNGDYFMRITGSVATIDDDGVGFDIQDWWHTHSVRNVRYEAVEHFDKQYLYGSSFGLGRKFILKEGGLVAVELELEGGIDVSNIENVARSYNKNLISHASWQTPESSRMHGVDNFAPYIDARISALAFNRVGVSAYSRQNTSGVKRSGLSLSYTFHPGQLYDLTVRTSIEKIEDAFNRIYLHDIGNSDKSYGLDFELKRRFNSRR